MNLGLFCVNVSGTGFHLGCAAEAASVETMEQADDLDHLVIRELQLCGGGGAKHRQKERRRTINTSDGGSSALAKPGLFWGFLFVTRKETETTFK